MAQILIDVRGYASTTAAPERAVVHAAARADGPQPQPVRDQVLADVARARSSLEALTATGAVTEYAIEQVRISAHRPWNDQGVRLPLVHSASVSITAQFADFQALSEWVLGDGLAIDYIDWRLTEQTQADLERRTRQTALRNAVTNAQDYADTLELGRVQVRTVRDPGVEPTPGVGRMMLAASMDSGGPSLELTPEPIEITAEVHAGFAVP